MKPSQHLMLSLVGGGVAWAITKEPLALPVALSAGTLVNGDHLPDLWWAYVLERKQTATFALHAWEWLSGLIITGVWIGYPWWLVAILVGYGLHIVTDHLFNNGRLLSYSILFRAYYRFRLEKVAPNWGVDDWQKTLQQEFPLMLRLMGWWKDRTMGKHIQQP